MNSSRLSAATTSVAPVWADDASWQAKLVADAQRAHANQSPKQRQITATLLERAVELGAEAFALTGSTARGQTTRISDLDYHVVGPRPPHGDLPAEVDVYGGDADEFWAKLRRGEDFVHWTLRFGCILFDRGTFRAGMRAITEEDLWPNPQLKLDRIPDMRRLALRLIEIEDRDAAHEQVRATLTTTARALLLLARTFPLARCELAGQLEEIGHTALAAALSRTIYGEPSLDELTTDLQLVRRALSTTSH